MKTAVSAKVQLADSEAEMLRCLWHLRYLSPKQIQRRWYPDRSLANTRSRLSRLKKKGLLDHAGLEGQHGPTAWRLTRLGCRKAAEVWFDAFDSYDQLTFHHLPHLLAVNEVFIGLSAQRGGLSPCWSALPFEWLGSHHSYRDFHDGSLDKRRKRRITPDATITARKGARGRRVFVELDDPQEFYGTKLGRLKTKRKLKSYAAFICGPRDDDRTFYARQFPDRRPPLVLFLTGDDRVESRRNSILQGMKRLPVGCGELAVDCCAASDVHHIWSAVFGKTQNDVLDRWRLERRASVELTQSDFLALAATYRRHAKQAKAEPHDWEFAQQVNAARDVLERIAKELAA